MLFPKSLFISADIENPVITGVDDVMHIIAACADNATVNWTEPTATDNSGYFTLHSSHAPGQLFPYGVTSVNFTAVDPSGNKVSISFIVTVVIDERGNSLGYLKTTINKSCCVVLCTGCYNNKNYTI